MSSFFPEGGETLTPSYQDGHQVLPNTRDGLIVSHHKLNNQRGKPLYGSFVEFINCGQTVVWLDNAVPLLPGGYRYIKNPAYSCKWEFGVLASPPATKSFYIQSGNNLKIILHKNSEAFAFINQGVGDITISGATVEITPATPITDDPTGELTLDLSITIPAGKTKVHIINKGDTVPVGGSFGNNATAEVTAGSLVTELPVDPDGFLLVASGTNTATNEYGTLPEITIDNTVGAAIWWYAV